MNLPLAGEEPRRGLARPVGIGLSILSLAAVVWWATRQEPPKLPSTPGQIAALVGALLAYAAATLLRGERWWRLLRREKAQTSRADAYALTAVGYMGNAVLPARGGDALRLYLAAPGAKISLRSALGALVAERVLDTATLLSLFALIALVLLRGIDYPSSDRLLLLLGVGAAVVALLVLTLTSFRSHPRARAMIGWLGPVTHATRRLRGGHGAAMFTVTLAIWIVEALTYLACAAAVGLEMSALEALYIVALASVFVLIPAGPGYVGTLDAAIVFGVRAIGGRGAEAISYLLVVRFVLLVPITVAGLALLIWRYGGWREVRSGAREARSA